VRRSTTHRRRSCRSRCRCWRASRAARRRQERIEFARHRLRHRARYAPVDHVDQAAARSAAVEQGGRAAEDLDLLGEDRLHGNPVIGAQGRDVHGADTAFEHAHPCAAQAADHGPAHAGAEIADVDARHMAHGLADRALRAVSELLGIEHADGRGEMAFDGAERIGSDDDFLQLVRMPVRRGLVALSGDGGAHGNEQDNTAAAAQERPGVPMMSTGGRNETGHANLLAEERLAAPRRRSSGAPPADAGGRSSCQAARSGGGPRAAQYCARWPAGTSRSAGTGSGGATRGGASHGVTARAAWPGPWARHDAHRPPRSMSA